ncbi:MULTISPECIES: acyl-CoA dehydrogenase family protein [unclassified Arthrobacter]|uniref:acyl-CoA dehydrogenase family protein n=1 Tax=unclassified Arthrobacter TaxID=235627 RepID=UPI001D15B3DD|nr:MULTISPECIES: acyl-CoA dehydrogenase family protein [unclassified Arthrobacter]MCC3292226.1 acyl-CoA dehydrogenase family protein [Arthrobacter sp. zg-Y1110]MCC3302686.1 acyl-CoA dehydrogenase family protein [Arthrobacter sp. zg-Y895]UWX85312.1 acyl-CoA dehydrogenase family protein [Arthrobacter sp. zg-Y1110]
MSSSAPLHQLPDADFYGFEDLLSDTEKAKLAELRRFLAEEVLPHAVDWWNEARFPSDLLPKLAQLELSTPVQQGYSPLFAGLVIAEMTRADTSLATFFMVHHDLFVEALHVFGSEEQKARLLDDARALRITGAFALTEPEHGSDVAGGMSTTAVRDGDTWVLNGAKRWIGNGTFCDYMVLWAREPETGYTRGFLLDANLPGVTRTRIENKTALRTVQNADIVLTDVRVPAADLLAGVESFDDTKQLLQGSRIMVGWQAVGAQLATFDVARAYAVERQQFGRPLAAFQLIQQQLVQILGNAVASTGMLARVTELEHGGYPVPGNEAPVAGAAPGDMARAALAKSYASARMRESVALGRSILGGNGIVTDYRMAKIFADAEAIYTYEGTYEINTLIVGRDITGVSALR